MCFTLATDERLEYRCSKCGKLLATGDVNKRLTVINKVVIIKCRCGEKNKIK